MTFFLFKNTVNEVYLTLSEKATLSASSIHFLFNLVDQQGKNQYNFLATNISTATSRYDLFEITETGSTYQNLTAGTVNLGNNYTWYTYNVYEQESDTNIDPANATSLLETGFCYLTGTTQQVTVKKHHSDVTIKSHK